MAYSKNFALLMPGHNPCTGELDLCTSAEDTISEACYVAHFALKSWDAMTVMRLKKESWLGQVGLAIGSCDVGVVCVTTDRGTPQFDLE